MVMCLCRSVKNRAFVELSSFPVLSVDSVPALRRGHSSTSSWLLFPSAPAAASRDWSGLRDRVRVDVSAGKKAASTVAFAAVRNADRVINAAAQRR